MHEYHAISRTGLLMRILHIDARIALFQPLSANTHLDTGGLSR
jgi:hypothetical protein